MGSANSNGLEESELGILPRVIHQLYKSIEEQKQSEFLVSWDATFFVTRKDYILFVHKTLDFMADFTTQCHFLILVVMLHGDLNRIRKNAWFVSCHPCIWFNSVKYDSRNWWGCSLIQPLYAWLMLEFVWKFLMKMRFRSIFNMKFTLNLRIGIAKILY